MSERDRAMAVLVAVSVAFGACRGADDSAQGRASAASSAAAPDEGMAPPRSPNPAGAMEEGTMRIESRSFGDGAAIPARFTCTGEDVSPALAVEDVPEGARTLALIVDDPDAPRGTFVQWLIWNIPADRAEIPEAVPPDGAASTLGGGTTQGKNGTQKVGYSGPCPPPGRGVHTYRFQLFAVDSELDLPSGASRQQLEDALEDHVLAQALLQGRFGR